MRKIVAVIDDMVEVDDDVEDLWKLDRARILVKTPWKPLIQHTVSVYIQGQVYPVHIMEESGSCLVGSTCCHCRRNTKYNSPEEIQSEESEPLSPGGGGNDEDVTNWP